MAVCLMAHQIKSVSLCEVTAKIARSIPNFSEFVRTMLLIHADESQLCHVVTLEEDRFTHFINLNNVHVTIKGRCNPFHKDGRCLICWPVGVSIDAQLWELKKEHSENVAE